MSARSKIEWTDATWNPVRGCSRVSEGCRNCYAERMASRFAYEGLWGHGYAKPADQGGGWTGHVALAYDVLERPLHWRKPRRVFVNSTSDLFHEKLRDIDIDRVFAVMAACPQHTFQVLTKRPERMVDYMVRTPEATRTRVECRMLDGQETLDVSPADTSPTRVGLLTRPVPWPLPNVWLGVSVEDQEAAERRIPPLLDTPAAVRFLSCEPLLGPLTLSGILGLVRVKSRGAPRRTHLRAMPGSKPWIGWVIAGGESGPGARPMSPEWVRSLRDQCSVAGVPFFMKQICDQAGRKAPWEDVPADLRVREVPT